MSCEETHPESTLLFLDPLTQYREPYLFEVDSCIEDAKLSWSDTTYVPEEPPVKNVYRKKKKKKVNKKPDEAKQFRHNQRKMFANLRMIQYLRDRVNESEISYDVFVQIKSCKKGAGFNFTDKFPDTLYSKPYVYAIRIDISDSIMKHSRLHCDLVTMSGQPAHTETGQTIHIKEYSEKVNDERRIFEMKIVFTSCSYKNKGEPLLFRVIKQNETDTYSIVYTSTPFIMLARKGLPGWIYRSSK
jgi:hypothetical protein